jgi:hypothetical protein
MHPDRAFPCCSCIVVSKAAQIPADVLWTLPEYTPVNASVFVSEPLTLPLPAAGLTVCLSGEFPPLPSTPGAEGLFGDEVTVGETAESSAQQHDGEKRWLEEVSSKDRFFSVALGESFGWRAGGRT